MPLEGMFESLTEADLQTLLTNRVAEGKAMEYKESLPDNTHQSKKDFLADVSSFANAAGGHLVFGIREENGVPVEICGLPGIDPDAEVERLESLIRHNIDPRMPGVSMRAVPLSTSDVAIVVRVPHSWAQPHVVNYEKHWRFYSRHSAGKYQLDVSEVGAAFALSATLAERIRLFRTERLARIFAGEAPADVGERATIVLHIVPLGAFQSASKVDIRSLGPDGSTLRPIGGSVAAQRYNLDGFLTRDYSNVLGRESYAQLFHSGIIEAVDTSILWVGQRKTPSIPSTLYESKLLQALPAYLSIQERLGMTPPVFVMLSLLRVCGFVMAVSQHLDGSGEFRHQVDRDVVVVPEVLVESFRADPAQIMRPIFDSVWNAAGWPRSMNYDESGHWCKGPNCRS